MKIPETKNCYAVEIKQHEDGILFYCDDANLGMVFDEEQAVIALESLRKFVETGEVD